MSPVTSHSSWLEFPARASSQESKSPMMAAARGWYGQWGKMRALSTTQQKMIVLFCTSLGKSGYQAFGRENSLYDSMEKYPSVTFNKDGILSWGFWWLGGGNQRLPRPVTKGKGLDLKGRVYSKSLTNVPLTESSRVNSLYNFARDVTDKWYSLRDCLHMDG